MSGHTPGPWRVCWYDCGDTPWYDHNGPCPAIVAPDDLDCTIIHEDGFKQKYWSACNGDQRQIEANARLIAAAPDLLDCARRLAALENEDGGRGFPSKDDCAAARAAIAKAEAAS